MVMKHPPSAGGRSMTDSAGVPSSYSFRIPVEGFEGLSKERTKWDFLPGNWKFLAVFLSPVALAWICFFDPLKDSGTEYFCAYVMALTGFYWTFDCMPLAATGFVPLIVEPLFRIEFANRYADQYMHDVGMMTFATSIIVLAVIASGLSKRISCKVLAIASADLRRIMLICMLITGLLSMWFVNTAIMLFMMNVVEEIVTELIRGVDIGTLGDIRMGEWNLANSGAVDTEAEEPMQDIPTVTNNDEPPPTVKAEPNKEKDKDVPKAVASVDSLDSFAEGLGDEGAADGNVPNPESSVTKLGSISHLTETRKVSVDSGGSNEDADPGPIIASVKPIEAPSADDDELTWLKKENDKLLASYKINLFHSIAIAGNIGGLFWPFGSTSSGAIFFYERTNGFNPPKFFHETQWMNFTFPILAISFAFACWWIDTLNFKIPKYFKSCSKRSKTGKETLLEVTSATVETRAKVQEFFKEKYESKGKFNSHEIGALLVTLLSVICFVLRRPGFIPGWASWFKYIDIKDSTLACSAVLSVFVIPKCGFRMFEGPKSPKDKASFDALLGWKSVQMTFPWGILIFLGGSMAIAYGCVKSEFNKNVVDGLMSMLKGTKPYPWLVLLISILITVGLAHFITNTAAAHIAAHILMQLSNKLGYGWCYLPVPSVVACSFAFLLPAGTPPMALAHMKTHKLNGLTCFIRGWPITLFCVALVYAFGLFYTDKLMTCSI